MEEKIIFPKEEEKSKDKINMWFIKFSFLFLGLTTMNTWNTILSSLDYYIKKLGDYNPSFTFPLMKGLVCVFFQYIFLIKKLHFSIKTRVIIIVFSYIIILILLPLSFFFFKNGLSVIISGMFVCLIGLLDGCYYNTIYILLSYFPQEYLIYKNTGQGFSGLTINILRFITMFIFSQSSLDIEKSKVYELILFYSISILIGITTIVMIIILYKNEIFLSYINKEENTDLNVDFTKNKYHEIKSNLGLYSSTDDNEDPINNPFYKSNLNNKINLLDLFDDLSINCFLIFIVFFITACLYPGCAFALEYFQIDAYYKPNSVIFLFNLFDTFGRYMPKYFKLSEKRVVILSFIRFIFIISFPFLKIFDKKNSISSILNILNLLLFSFSNGYLASIIYILSYELVKQVHLKKFAILLSLFISLGYTFGSLFAELITKNLLL